MESDKKNCLDLQMYIMIYEHSLCFEASSVNDSPWYMLFFISGGSAKRFDVWFLQVVLTELSLERFYNGFLPICQLHFLVLVPIFSLS